MKSAATDAALPALIVILRYFRVDRRDIAYFRFILEAYEGLATLSTLDPQEGIVVVRIPECFSGDADDLLAAIAREIRLAEIEAPDN